MKAKKVDTRKSIEQLEADVWNNYDFPTPLVEKVHRYRKIPVDDLSIEQMRMLIVQDVGLIYLVPITIQKLNENILAEGDMYEGDLLSAILTVKEDFWSKHPALKKEIQELVKGKRTFIESRNESNIHRQLLRKIDAFTM